MLLLNYSGKLTHILKTISLNTLHCYYSAIPTIRVCWEFGIYKQMISVLLIVAFIFISILSRPIKTIFRRYVYSIIPAWYVILLFATVVVKQRVTVSLIILAS